MRQLAIRAHVPAAALALAAGVGGCFTGPAPDATGPTSAVPAIQLSTNALSFAAPTGAADPAPQMIRVDDGGGSGTLEAPTASIGYVGTGTGWLSAAVAGSSPPYTITVKASVGSLAVGSYAATMEIASPNASNTPQSVVVTLTVGSSSQPSMAVMPAALTFSSTGGATPPAQTVTVSNAGVGTLAPPIATPSYTGQPSGWLSVTVSGAAAPYTLTVQPIVTGLMPRPVPYGATISVDCPGASNTPLPVTVQLTVR
jgi:hypothetical protein